MDTKSGSIFDQDEFKPYAKLWRARSQALARRAGYATGDVYKQVRGQLGWLWPRLYSGIKPLYLPLMRAVHIDAGIIPGDWAFPNEAPPAWDEARDLLWAWSEWATRGVLYVHYSAMYGVTGIKIADIRDERRVVMDPIDPATFMLIYGRQYDQTPEMALVIEAREDRTGEFEYAEAITRDSIRTYRDGVPFGFDGRDPEYMNELGFVPFVEARHIETGAALGDCTYADAIPMLNEVNELASYLADVIKKHAEPQWVVAGAEASELVKSGDNVWFLPQGASVQPVVAGIDIAGVLAFVQEIAQNVKDALPETAFDELRRKDQIATATLELQLMDLVLKVKRIRPNLDAGMVTALRMAAEAAATMGIGDLADLLDDDLTLDDQRPVLPMDPETAMRLELQEIELEREKQLERGKVIDAEDRRDEQEPEEDQPDQAADRA